MMALEFLLRELWSFVNVWDLLCENIITPVYNGSERGIKDHLFQIKLRRILSFLIRQFGLWHKVNNFTGTPV